MLDLTKKKCKPCEGGIAPLTRKKFSKYLEQVSEWNVIEDDTKLEREYTLKNFASALAFVNAIGILAEQEAHHPDIYIHSWCKVKLTLYTHSIGGLSENDFVLAAKIDRITHL